MNGSGSWRDRPSTWVAAGVMTITAIVVFTPSVDVRGTVPRLSSRSAAPGGARGLHDLAKRLGWDVVRSDSQPIVAPLEPAVYAVLAPPVPLTAAEVSDLLARVRAGAGLLTVAENDTPLADSLRVQVSPSSGALPWDSSAACGERAAFSLLPPVWSVPAVEPSRGGPADMVTFLTLDAYHLGSVDLPAVVGFAYGRGRVGVVSDPMLLSNDMLKECTSPAGLATAGLLQFLRASPAGRARIVLVFDEFHHGYGAQPSVARASRRMLLGTPAGRGLLQLSLAGIILLAAVAPRPLPPREEERRQRRSPLEHVNALAAAYQEVGATRTATRRLVSGLRRRLSQGRLAPTPDSDEDFLRALMSARPETGPEAKRVLNSLAHPVTARELIATRDSIRRIERVLSRE